MTDLDDDAPEIFIVSGIIGFHKLLFNLLCWLIPILRANIASQFWTTFHTYLNLVRMQNFNDLKELGIDMEEWRISIMLIATKVVLGLIGNILFPNPGCVHERCGGFEQWERILYTWCFVKKEQIKTNMKSSKLNLFLTKLLLTKVFI